MLKSIVRFTATALVFFMIGLAFTVRADSGACPPTSTPAAVSTQDISTLPTAEASAGTRKNPIPLGQVGHRTNDDKTEQYDIAISNVIRGDAAWQWIEQNDPYHLAQSAEAGKEYVIFYVRFKYVSGPEDKTELFTSADFAIEANDQVFTDVLLYSPPGAFLPRLFPDGSASGWVVKSMTSGASNPLAIWGDPDTGGLYFALQ